MPSNYVVSGLPAYVQTNKDIILKNFALVGGSIRKRISIQTGVKGSAYLNFLAVAPTLQSGAGCGFSAAGTATLSQKTVVTAPIKVNMEICDKTVMGKYAEYLVRWGANNEEFPFERVFVDGLTDEINRKIEKLIWQGDHTQSSDTDIKWIDGFIYQFDNDADVIDVALAHGTSAYNAIKGVYMGLTEEALERGAEIYVSPALYREFLQAMVEKNYFHYAGPQDSAPDEFVFPGTDVKVVKSPGLAGVNDKIVGTFPENLVYACDAESDSEEFKIWFSDDDDILKVKVLWNSGVAYHFGNHVTLGTIAAS